MSKQTRRSRLSTSDPGLGSKLSKDSGRLLNKDGSFNVDRRGIPFSTRDIYVWLVRTSWPAFLAFVLLTYVLLNTFFALVYLGIGIENLEGVADSSSPFKNFLNAFFFSVQTFTTVGYGSIAPSGVLSGLVASLEALVGLLGFALATGLLYGRFSRPQFRIMFSENVLFTPRANEKRELHFRIANMRSTAVMNVKAQVILSIAAREDGNLRRNYFRLPLRIDSIIFFPLNWTIVHEIDENSPLYDVSAEDLKNNLAELIVLISGFDEAFGQEIHARYSYTSEDFIWNARFKMAFHLEEDGKHIFELDKLSEYEKHQP